MSRGKLALVPTRYGEEVVGGAEAVLREAAHGLAARGWDVDILTTCATNHYTWANDYPAGTTTDGAVTVRRFPTVHDGPRLRRDAIERRLQLGLPATYEEELTWLNGGFRVPDLFHYLLSSEADYRGIVLAPYLFWTTVSAALIAPQKTIVMPCLHDEHYAYLKVFRGILSDPAQVWFLSEPEHELGHRLAPLGPHVLTGAGVHSPAQHDADAGRVLARTHRPFIYYGGRRETGKGWDELLGAFTRAVVDYGVNLDLVTTGTRAVAPAPVVADRVIDLGNVADEQRAHIYAAAAAYVQPSKNESFSRTIMESWLAGTGVIANAASDVVAWHCERSGGGITYDDVDELVQAIVLIADHPGALDGLGPAGREYVEKEYLWPNVLDRMEQALEQLPE
jgi:glycosyltransferase involved in cell wall biosynthesis